MMGAPDMTRHREIFTAARRKRRGELIRAAAWSAVAGALCAAAGWSWPYY